MVDSGTAAFEMRSPKAAVRIEGEIGPTLLHAPFSGQRGGVPTYVVLSQNGLASRTRGALGHPDMRTC